MHGRQLKEYRENRGLTQHQLASMINGRLGMKLDQGRVSKLEKSLVLPSAIASLVQSDSQQAATAASPKGTVITVANQKGGVAKTTVVVALAYELAARCRVCVVDLDPSLNASTVLRQDDPALEAQGCTMASLIETKISKVGDGLDGFVCTTDYGDREVFLIPGSKRTAQLSHTDPNFTRRVEKVLDHLADRFDVVLVDTPPVLGPVLYGAIYGSDRVLIPFQAAELAAIGLADLLETIFDAVDVIKDDFAILGFVPTMVEKRAAVHAEVLAEVIEKFADIAPVFAPIYRRIAFDQAKREKLPIGLHAPGIDANAVILDIADQIIVLTA